MNSIRVVTFQIGVDPIGQPLFISHLVEERKKRHTNRSYLIVKSKHHR